MTIYLLHHGDSFILSLLSSLLIEMRKNNFSVTTTFHTRNNNACLLFYYTDKFINRYMAEGVLCNCLEATSRLQSRLQYLSTMRVHTHAHVVITPLHKTCTQHQLTHFNCSITYNYEQQFGLCSINHN